MQVIKIYIFLLKIIFLKRKELPGKYYNIIVTSFLPTNLCWGHMEKRLVSKLHNNFDSFANETFESRL